MLVSSAMVPPRLCLMVELTNDDVYWINKQLDLCDKIEYTYANELPIPPLPSGNWITTERIR